MDELFLLAVGAENSHGAIGLLQLWLGHTRLTSATILHLPSGHVNPEPREKPLPAEAYLPNVCWPGPFLAFSSNSAKSIVTSRLVGPRTPGWMSS
jgi:hypothetical protein